MDVDEKTSLNAKLDAAITYQKELRNRIINLYTRDEEIKARVLKGVKKVQANFRRKMETAERRHNVYRIKINEKDSAPNQLPGFNFVWECVKTFLKDRN